MRQVCILQHRLLHYRVPLFDGLRSVLAEHGVEMILVHGQPSPREAQKRDIGSLSWATEVHNRYLRIAGRDLLWQAVPAVALKSDLIIAMQENKILSNYWLQTLWRRPGRLFAFWGHGRNMQSVAPDGLRERWKRFFVNRVDWWFAYTAVTVEFLRRAGFEKSRITCLNNTVDVAAFKRELAAVTEIEIESLLDSLKIKRAARIGLYCGSLYAEKRLDTLIEVGRRIHQKIPEFRLLIIGDGPHKAHLQEICAREDWVRVVGVKKGREKAVFHRAAELLICPGALGLQVLDSFAASLPVITLASSLHGPEAAYLKSGENALVFETDDMQAFANEIVALFKDAPRLTAMRARCAADSEKYTLENMIQDFATGILQCLQPTAVSLRLESTRVGK